jgi:alpha-glucosidase
VKGMEYVGFDQRNADEQPEHSAILPFTRNAIGPMDFTPTVFNRKVRQFDRRTSDAFELALAVLFESGVQHMGLTPKELSEAPEFVVEMLKAIPPAWDDVRFVDGHPGRDVVLARRSGEKWFVAGINGSGQPRAMTLDLRFVGPTVGGVMIGDDANGRGFARRALSGEPAGRLAVTVPPRGGFLMALAPGRPAR